MTPIAGLQKDRAFNPMCKVEGTSKVASVCGPRRHPSGIGPGYLQYRFGPVGRPEFVFPASTRPAASRDVFRFEHQSTRDGSTQDYFLWFRNGQWIYEIYYREEFDDCSEAGCSSERTGQAAFVSAWRGPQAWSEGDESRGKRHRCTNPAESEPFKEIAEFASTLSAHDTKARIFAPLPDDKE